MKMTTPAATRYYNNYRMRSLALILVAGFLVHCEPINATPLVSASPQVPAFEQLTDQGVVLALFDLHRDTDQNGTCNSLDPRALIAAHAAMWSHETLIKTSPQPCSGLRIFDVCGSGTTALDTILSELKKTGCNHNITGIITFTSANVYFSIKNLLSRLKMPQTIIWRDANPLPEASNPEQHFIRIKSEEKAMSLLELTKSLNWTYVTTKSSDSRDATEEHRSFLDTAAKTGSNLCFSLPATQKENSNDEPSISSTNAMLYFINGLSPGGQHTPASLTNSTMKVILFITDNETDLNHIVLNSTTNGLLLREDVPSIKDVYLGEYLVNKTRLGLYQGSSLSWRWLKSHKFCAQKETGASEQTECDHGSLNKFMSEALNLKASHAAIESVRRTLAHEIDLFELSDEDVKFVTREKRSQSGEDASASKDATFPNATSSDANDTKDLVANANAGHGSSGVRNVTHQMPKQFMASRFVFKVSNQTRALEPNTTFSLFATVGPVFQKVGQISGSFYPLDKTRWRLISEKLTGSHCPGYCPACTRCTQDTTQMQQQQQQQQQQHNQQQEPTSLIKKYRAGHLYIALVLPLEESASCTDIPSAENARIVQEFLKSVDTLKEEEPTSHLGYTLGGIVIDSCRTEKPPHHQRRPLDKNISPSLSCYTLKDDFNISRQVSNENIASYIHLPNLNSFSTAKIGEFRTKSSTIPDITISRIGSFLDAIQVAQYVKVILKALPSLRWTYLTVVCSENTLMVELQRRLLMEAKKKNICIRDLIKMTELRAAGYLDVRYSLLQEESTAVILLTDAHDTIDFLRFVSKTHNSSHILNFLFFPWNSALHPNLGTNLFQSSILVEINDPVANEIPKNITSMSVSELESQLELCLLSPSSSVYCPTGTINRGPTEPVLANYVASFVNAVGRGLAALHSQLCPDGEEGMCKAYQDWSRVMSLLRQRLRVGPVSLFNNSRKFDSSGTLRVNYAIKNLQRIRGKFQWTQVGEYNTNGSLSLSPKSVQGYNALQDVTAPAIQCKRWCPRCYQCDLTHQRGKSDDSDAALYIPGDVLITAVMPVRKRGHSPFECGTINTEDDVDQLVLALLYAVTTAKQRHPDLLDGVNPGLLVLDSCSTKERAMMVAGNFESCSMSIHLQGPNQRKTRRDAEGANNNGNVKGQALRNIGYYRTWGASPRLSPVYIAVGTSEILNAMTSSISDFKKPVLAVDQKGRSRRAERDSDLSDTTLSLSLAAKTRMEAIVSLLLKYQWTHISVVASESIENRRLIKLFNDLAKEAKVCVNHVLMLEDPELSGDDIFRQSESGEKSKLKVVSENPNLQISEDLPRSFACALRDLAKGNTTRIAVALVSEEHFMKLDSLIKENGLSIIWVFDQSDSGWEGDLFTSSMPLGSFTIGRQTRVYRGFKEYYNRQSNRRISEDNMNQAMSDWLEQQWDSRFGCDLPGQDSKYGVSCPPQDSEHHEISPVTTDVIRAADAVMFALQTEYAAKCGSKGGLCTKFARQWQPITLASFQKILVNAENDSFQFNPSREVETSIAIYNRQAKGNGSQLVQVAEWRNRILTPTKGRQIKLYDRSGEELDRNNEDLLMPTPSCTGTRCSCVNIHTEPTPIIKSLNSSTMALTLRREGYSKTTGQFTGTIWATVVMTVAAAGVLTAIGIFLYLLYKYCAGTGGGRRYSLLGMLLLFALVIQFATILPFVFTANALICEMRYFAPGFGYSFTLGIILVKLMNLYDYRMIGLGGTLSGMNQLLMVLFVGGVQVAVGAQRWMLKGSAFVRVVTYYGVTMYGCAFDKYEFVYYLSYPAFLQIVCLLYSIGMYKEKRNLREAKYVLIASALCIAVWIAWLLVYFLRPDDLRQPAIAIGILANACLNLAVIFIPKIHMMATLKYDVNKTSQDHYSTKADSDFFFERPFSLPGTLKTSVSDKTYSRSYTAFNDFDHSSGSV